MSFFSAEHREESSLCKLIVWRSLQACALFNCFKQGFNCIADIKISILAAKKNTLKATRTEMFFVHILPWSQIHSHQFDASVLLKKMFEGVWDSDFEWSEQVKFVKFLRSAPTMVAPRGSLNSWNQCINDQPLYQSLLSFQSSRFSNMTKKWQKPEYLENEKSFWGEIKTSYLVSSCMEHPTHWLDTCI